MHSCRFFNADSTVCFADGNDGSHRRYNWIEFENGQKLGRVGKCSQSRKVGERGREGGRERGGWSLLAWIREDQRRLVSRKGGRREMGATRE